MNLYKTNTARKTTTTVHIWPQHLGWIFFYEQFTNLLLVYFAQQNSCIPFFLKIVQIFLSRILDFIIILMDYVLQVCMKTISISFQGSYVSKVKKTELVKVLLNHTTALVLTFPRQRAAYLVQMTNYDITFGEGWYTWSRPNLPTNLSKQQNGTCLSPTEGGALLHAAQSYTGPVRRIASQASSRLTTLTASQNAQSNFSARLGRC